MRFIIEGPVNWLMIWNCFDDNQPVVSKYRDTIDLLSKFYRRVPQSPPDAPFGDGKIFQSVCLNRCLSPEILPDFHYTILLYPQYGSKGHTTVFEMLSVKEIFWSMSYLRWLSRLIYQQVPVEYVIAKKSFLKMTTRRIGACLFSVVLPTFQNRFLMAVDRWLQNIVLPYHVSSTSHQPFFSVRLEGFTVMVVFEKNMPA
jgi:hypothetical protein